MWSFAGITYWMYGTVPNAMLLRRFTKYVSGKADIPRHLARMHKANNGIPGHVRQIFMHCWFGFGYYLSNTNDPPPPPPAHELCKKDTWSLGLFRLPPHNPPKYYIFLTILARVPRAKPHQLPHHCVSRRICKYIFIHLECIVRPAETTTLYIRYLLRFAQTRHGNCFGIFVVFNLTPPQLRWGQASDKSNCSRSFKNTTIVGRSGTRP